jgi:hypothetical protein
MSRKRDIHCRLLSAMTLIKAARALAYNGVEDDGEADPTDYLQFICASLDAALPTVDEAYEALAAAA